MKAIKLFILFILLVSFKQVKSQCLDSIKVGNNSIDSVTFNIYLGNNNDTTNLVIYNRWGQLIKKILNDSIMQNGSYVITYSPPSLVSNMYVYLFTSRGGCRHGGNIQFTSSTSINKNKENGYSFNLFPNPSNSSIISIEFQAQSNSETQVIICDMMGRTVYSNNLGKSNDINSSYSLDISNLSSGVYIVNLVFGKMKVYQKFIKN